ncbi:MAG: hypothetical protein JXM69_11075 [Anaerolineae bacterium]|nr:hypothetical protein [Anaerolineae bacterium]
MKKGLWIGLITIGVFWGMFVWLASPLQAQEAEACQQANQYLDDGLLAIAEETYLGILANNPEATCARAGLVEVAKRRCQLAAQYTELGLTDKSREIYDGILAAYPDVACAAQGLKEVAAQPSPEPTPTPTATPSGYQKAEALHQTGIDDKAWENFVSAIEANPQDADRGRLANQFWVWWQRGSIFLKIYLQPALLTLIYIIVFGFLLYLFIRLIRFWIHNRKLRLDVDKFETGAVKLEPDPSGSLVIQVEQALQRLGKTDKLHRAGLIDQPVSIETLQLPEIEALPKDVNQVWNFLVKLFPPNVITLSGVLQHDPGQGAGLSLRITHAQSKQIWGSYTLWQQEVDPKFSGNGQAPNPTDYLKLAEVAATWAYWTIEQYQEEDGHTQERLRRVFGTDSWRSYINTCMAARLLNAGEKEAAEKTLRKALTDDHENRHALFNLAMVEVEGMKKQTRREKLAQGQDPYQQASAYFKRVQKLSKEIVNQGTDPANIFALYQLGAIELYKYTLTYTPKEEPCGGLKDARTNLKEGPCGGLKDARTNLNKAVLKARGNENGQTWLARLLTSWWELVSKAKGNENGQTAVITDELKAVLDIAYAIVLLLESDKKLPDPKSTRTPIPPAGDLSEQGQSQESDDPVTIIKDIEGKGHFDPAILYNLACYYSTAVTFNKSENPEFHLEQALAYLDQTLKVDRDHYANWAKDDPSLEALSQRKKKEFQDLLQIQADDAQDKTIRAKIKSKIKRFLKKLDTALGL